MGGPPTRQPGFLQICCKAQLTGVSYPHGMPLARLKMGRGIAHTRGRKLLSIKDFSGALSSVLNIGPHRVRLGLDPLHAVLHQVADRDNPANLVALNDGQMAKVLVCHQAQTCLDTLASMRCEHIC